MGGRGSSSGMTPQTATPFMRAPKMAPPQSPQQQQPPAPDPIVNQVPDNTNTPITPNALDNLVNMSDAQLAQLFNASQNTALPNHLGDANDQTQRFVFQIGLNDKPMVLDAAAFAKYMSDNGISQSQILARSVNGGVLKTSSGGSRNLSPKDIVEMMTSSRLNYIGGKHGGQAYGAGTYFDMNGGGSTGYGSGMTVHAVLNPKTAKVITSSQLRVKAQQFDQSHPQFAKATGGYSTSFNNNNMSIYALAMGYNVIKSSHSGYHNIIDRKALVYKK